MTPVDTDAIKQEIEAFLPLRESQITAFTDSMLLRNTQTGACGLASCIYVEWNGTPYAISCHHVLEEKREYIAGAKRVTGKTIDEEDSHAVAPLSLIGSDKSLDLALFDLNGLTLSSIPKQAHPLAQSRIDFERAKRNLQTVAFIHAVPGFGSRGIQYEDGLVFMQSPIYSAYGPIVEVSEDLIVADFAERELGELNVKDFPHLRDFTPTGGARDLSGMSGSGLWVFCTGGFALAGVLLGPEKNNDPKSQHLIRFTPIWKLVQWLEYLNIN